MKQQRSVGMCIVLSIITCGIYGMYWFVCVSNETDAVTGEYGPGGGMCLLLTIVTCGIYSWYFIYSIARDVNVLCAGDGQKTSGLLAFILLNRALMTISHGWKINGCCQEDSTRYGLLFAYMEL